VPEQAAAAAEHATRIQLCFDIFYCVFYGGEKHTHGGGRAAMTFKDRMDKLIDKSKVATKEVIEKAKEKTKELKEKTSLKLEIRHQERQAEKTLARLGSTVYDIFITKGQATLSKGNAEVKNLLTEIAEIEKKIDEAEAELKKLG
jgi:hypothetical protein